MLQYLVILLDDTSTSYCYYNINKTKRGLISLEDLKTGIIFAMKQNLMIQFVYPSYEIPMAYKETIETIDHIKIMPADLEHISTADVVIFNSCKEFSEENIEKNKDKIFVLRTSGRDVACHVSTVERASGTRDVARHVSTVECASGSGDVAHHVSTVENVKRLNIMITDIETFTDENFNSYEQTLSELASAIHKAYFNGKTPQINILTDRIELEKMNSCNAGVENITLAPNVNFYVCPAFYYENEKDNIGNLKDGLNIKNQQLYKLEYARLCRTCDAYQCKRCVWLNRKTTLEVNTPSHEQCVVSHLERNESKELLNELKQAGYFPNREIPAIDYLDPFDLIAN